MTAWTSSTRQPVVGDTVRHTYNHTEGPRTIQGTVDRLDRGHALVDFDNDGFAYLQLVQLEVVEPAEMECTATHGHILSGRARTREASFGAFIATQARGAEILSVSGWIARWTGEYTWTADGHHAAVLERLRNTDGRAGSGPLHIHTCAMNHWTSIGRWSMPDGAAAGAVIDVRHLHGTLTPRCSIHGLGEPRDFGDPVERRAAYAEAEDHAREHPPIDVTGWRTWPSDRLEAALDVVDDSTALWDAMSDEIAQRDHEHRTRVNNGGILP